VAMGTRFALSLESPIPHNVKQRAADSSVEDTVYGSNFDGIPSRVLRTDTAVKAMAKPMNPLTVATEALKNARHFNVPIWKVLPGKLELSCVLVETNSYHIVAKV
jgi:enoyl-[acyl-carrier protein] reductase II